MTAAARWTAGIVGLLGLCVASVTTLIVASARADGRQVMPNYDTRALAHGEVMAQHARDEALGWTAALAFDGPDVVVTLRDRTGAPVRGAAVTIAMYHRAHAARVITALAAETPGSPGVYRGGGGALQAGIHTITGEATLGDTRFTFDGWAEATP